MAASDDQLAIADTLPVLGGRYELRERLGDGGYGTVYVASDTRLQRDVAVKVLRHDPSDDDARYRRLEREAFMPARLDHPDIVQIYDVGRCEDGRAYVVMELVRGVTLEEEIRARGALDRGRAVRLLTRVLGAVGRAHAAGIVHRDLKPANLMVVDPGTPDERLRVLDFGLARDPTVSDSSSPLVGTPLYIPPELVAGGRSTKASDVYQIGLIFLEMLAGRPAVAGETIMQCLYAHTHGIFDVPVDAGDPELTAILRVALSRTPEDRFPDAGAFRAALDDLPTILQLPPPAVVRVDAAAVADPDDDDNHDTLVRRRVLASRMSRPRGRIAVVGAVAVLGGAALAVGGLWSRADGPRAPASTDRRPPALAVAAPTAPVGERPSSGGPPAGPLAPAEPLHAALDVPPEGSASPDARLAVASREVEARAPASSTKAQSAAGRARARRTPAAEVPSVVRGTEGPRGRLSLVEEHALPLVD